MFQMFNISPTFTSLQCQSTVRLYSRRYQGLRVGDDVKVTHLETGAAESGDAVSIEFLRISGNALSPLELLAL